MAMRLGNFVREGAAIRSDSIVVALAVNSEAVLDEMIRRCNAHDDLVAALEEMVEQFGGMVDSPRVEEPARLAVEHAKAALAKAGK